MRIPLNISETSFFESFQIEIPELTGDAAEFLPMESNGFGQDLLSILKSAFHNFMPLASSGVTLCLTLICITLLCSILLNSFKQAHPAVQLTGVIAIAAVMLHETQVMVHLASDTITRLSDYGKLLLPVLTAALAAAGGSTSSTALYTATAVFDAVICAAIQYLLVPLVYIYLVFSLIHYTIEEELIQKLRDFCKWILNWSMKCILTIFAGYISITGIITGTVDQAAVKATKATISSVIPVVGGMLSDASETVLIGASVVKNAAGVYGILALIALLVLPILQISTQYILLRITAALSNLFAHKNLSGLIDDFATAMGFLLAMTGAVCLVLLISIVCFLKGMG